MALAVSYAVLLRMFGGFVATVIFLGVSPINICYLLVGAFVGMIVGVIPGFGPSAGLAILLPVTFGMDPIGAIMMLAAIYYGAMYGGTITSILLNTPGESATVASTFDGFPLAKKGRAGPALVMQAAASFVGGTVGVILITILAPLFSQVSHSFGPPEYFLLAMMGMLTLLVMIGTNWKLGVISALAGFALGTVGVDLETGQGRYTFGSAELIGGIYFIPITIGLFGLGELFYAFYNGLHKTGTGGIVQYNKEERFWPTAQDWVSTRMTMVRGSILGVVVGVIPGAGATIASLMAYSTERSVSKNSANFGKGEMAGLVAPETANNAASSGAMIPLLTLGIPGSASTAFLLAAFLLRGLRPGPLFMEQNPEFAWRLIASMYLGIHGASGDLDLRRPAFCADDQGPLPRSRTKRGCGLCPWNLQRSCQLCGNVSDVCRWHCRVFHAALRLLPRSTGSSSGPWALGGRGAAPDDDHLTRITLSLFRAHAVTVDHWGNHRASG